MPLSIPYGGTHTRDSRAGKVSVVLVAALGIAAILFITAHRPGPVLGSSDFSISPTFGIPAPPHHEFYNATGNLIATIALTLFGMIGVVLGLLDLVKRRTVLPLMIALSGTMIAIPEVFVDIMGAVYYPWSPGAVAYKILGREMPWWIVAGWFGYGTFSLIVFRIFEMKPLTRVIWWLWGVTLAADVLFEELLLTMNVYHYYGNQPLIVISKLGWWWLPCNSVGVILAAALAYRYQDRLRGWRALAMFFLTPMSVSAVYGFIAMPSWIVVNGNYSWLVTQGAGLLTLALGFGAFCVVLDVVLGRKPFDLAGNEHSGQSRVKVAS